MIKDEIITICGSSSYNDEIGQYVKYLELKGFIVFSYSKIDNNDISEKEKQILADLWKRKIDISDSIIVCNYNCYIGESTKNEIEYAISQNKNIYFMKNPEDFSREILFNGYGLSYSADPIPLFKLMKSCEFAIHKYNEDQYFHFVSEVIPKVKEDVIKFIHRIVNKTKINSFEYRTSIEELFSYHSYYFALILKDRFGGKILWSSEQKTTIWADENNICYNLYGIVSNEIPEGFVSIDYLSKEELDKIKHI